MDSLDNAINSVFEYIKYFSKDLRDRLGVKVDITKEDFEEHVMDVVIGSHVEDTHDLIEELSKYELNGILELDILKVDFENNTIDLYVINALGSGEDWKFNRIITVDKDGCIIGVYNGLYKEIRELDISDIIQLWALEQYLNDEILKDMINKKVNEFFE